MANDRVVAEASRGLLNHLKRLGDDSAIGPQVMSAFLSAHGDGDMSRGAEKLGQNLKEDFDRVRGVGLSEDELKYFERRDGAIIKFHTLIQDLVNKQDAYRQIDVSGLTDEDLSNALIDVAVQHMLADEEMQRKVFARLFEEKPGMRAEIMEMGGAQVVESPPVIPAPEPVYDEVTGDE